MIELPVFLSLCDYVVKLLDIKNKRSKAYFEEMVKPCYSAARIVRDDLIAICNDLEQSIEENTPPEKIEKIFIQVREKERGTREALRAALELLPANERNSFESALISMLRGGHEHAIVGLHSQVSVAIRQSQRLIYTGNATDDTDDHKARALRHIHQAKEHAVNAWKEVAAGYNEYVKKLIKNPA